MSDTFKKSDKFFKLSDSSLNSYGFRLLTTGYQITEFAKNPVGYYMHGTTEFPREGGVVLKWEDLQIQGDSVIGKPVINLSHPRGEKTVSEVENGFLNAASMGHFVVLETSDDEALRLPGQTGPTVTKWFNRECSLVDIPGNFNALQLFDSKETPMLLCVLKSNGNQVQQSAPGNQAPQQMLLSISDILGDAYNKVIIDEKLLHELKNQFKNNPTGIAPMLQMLADNKCKLSLRNKSFYELDKSGELPFLKEFDPVGFTMKLIETFGEQAALSNLNNLSAADQVTVKSNADAAKAELLQRLTSMSWEEIDRSDHLAYFEENAPIAFAAKSEYKFGKEHKSVELKSLDRQKVKDGVAAERRMHIERLKAKSYLQLDKQDDMEFLKVAAPDIYREKYKEFHGKYPTK